MPLRDAIEKHAHAAERLHVDDTTVIGPPVHHLDAFVEKFSTHVNAAYLAALRLVRELGFNGVGIE